MKTPSIDDLHIAAQWLEIYEGAEDAEACHRVARWLLKKAADLELKEVCGQAGVSVTEARRAIKKHEGEQ